MSALAQTQVDCNALYTLETECNNQASCAWTVEQERCDTAPAEKTAFNDYLASTTSERKQTDAVIAWCNAITTEENARMTVSTFMALNQSAFQQSHY